MYRPRFCCDFVELLLCRLERLLLYRHQNIEVVHIEVENIEVVCVPHIVIHKSNSKNRGPQLYKGKHSRISTVDFFV